MSALLGQLDAPHSWPCCLQGACGIQPVATLSCLPIPRLHRWAEQGDGGRALVPEASHAGHVLALYLATRGDLVVVGELSWRCSQRCMPACHRLHGPAACQCLVQLPICGEANCKALLHRSACSSLPARLSPFTPSCPHHQATS